MLCRVLSRAQESDVKRVDDNEDVFKGRIQVFLKETMPVVEHFRGLKHVIEIDSEKNKDEMLAQFHALEKTWKLDG